MLGNKIDFKNAKIPFKKYLNGNYVVVEPLNIKKHSKDLFESFILDKQNIIWKYLSYGPFKAHLSFKKWLKSDCLKKDPFFYAVYSKKHKRYCGMASYLDIHPEHGSIEVGHINYSPLLQNTLEGTECMYLMMKNAFEKLGNRRYAWRCNNLNEGSKKAAIRLGFKFEGIFRQMYIHKRRNRDTAWFSIIDNEWKKLEKGYLKFLKSSNFDKNFKQIKKLKLR